MEKTRNAIIATAIAGASFAGGAMTSEQTEVVVYRDNPERVIEVLSEISVSDVDFGRLVPTGEYGSAVEGAATADSDIVADFQTEVLAGRAPTATGILTADEIGALYFEAARGKLTGQDALDGASLHDVIRRVEETSE